MCTMAIRVIEVHAPDLLAAAHEIIRQRRRDLTFCRLTPDLVADQLIARFVTTLVFSWGGIPGRAHSMPFAGQSNRAPPLY